MACESGASRALRASRCARFTEAEEGLGVAGGFFGELLYGFADGARYGLGNVREERRLVAARFRLRTHVARREVGRVGLEEQPIGGNVAHELEQVRAAALVANPARDADVEAEVEVGVQLVLLAGEAMRHRILYPVV